jgi:hypothetical protein
MRLKFTGLTVRIGLDRRSLSPTLQATARLWLLIAIFCLSSFPTAGASVTGSISGIVTDKSGAVIVGAEVAQGRLQGISSDRNCH